MDYGKFKYEEAQKAKEARRNQANTILKEVRFRLKIDVHDYETKRKRAEGFLAAGDKVKAMILFRGREQSRPDQGVRLLQRFAEDVAEFGSVESTPTIDGRNMVMVIGPHKTKATAKAEAVERRAASKPARSPLEEQPAAEIITAEKVAAATPAAVKATESAPAAAESPAPKAEAPKAEAPKVEAPKTEAPKTEVPKAAAPKAAAPKAPAAPRAPATPKAPAPKGGAVGAAAVAAAAKAAPKKPQKEDNDA